MSSTKAEFDSNELENEDGAELELDTTEEEVEDGSEEEAGAEAEADEEGTDEGQDELVVSIEGESPAPEDHAEKAPSWVKDLRKQYRDLQKEKRHLEDQVRALSGAEHKPAPLGKKPTLEDVEWDEQKYEAELSAWYERKRQVEAEEQQVKAAAEAQAAEWNKKLEGYTTAKSSLKVRDYEEAELVAQEALDITQQGVIIHGADNAALLVYALGKNPKVLKELASIKDPVKFAFAVSKLENKLKTTQRKPAAAPEKTVQGTGKPTSGTVDSNLDRLRAEAERTGDYTKVVAYRKQQRSKGK